MASNKSSIDIKTISKFFFGLASAVGINYETLGASQGAVMFVQDKSKDYLDSGKTIEDFIELLNTGVKSLKNSEELRNKARLYVIEIMLSVSKESNSLEDFVNFIDTLSDTMRMIRIKYYEAVLKKPDLSFNEFAKKLFR
jgi:hypothetical protein